MNVPNFLSSVLKLASIGVPFLLYLTNSGDLQLYGNILGPDFCANAAFVVIIR